MTVDQNQNRILGGDGRFQCATCHRAANPAHFCDQHEGGPWCDDCWRVGDCTDTHGEGCHTAFWEDTRAAPDVTALASPPVGLDREGVRKLTMPNGDVLESEYPNSANWARSWTMYRDGRCGATGEQDWEIVERYGLTVIIDAILALLASGGISALQPSASVPTEQGEGAVLALLDEWGENWILAKGKTRPDEPLYGCQLMVDTEIVAQGEGETALAAVEAAFRSGDLSTATWDAPDDLGVQCLSDARRQAAASDDTQVGIGAADEPKLPAVTDEVER